MGSEPMNWLNSVEAFRPQLQAILLTFKLVIPLGLIGFIPAVRQALARLLPMQPESFGHAVMLASVSTLIVISLTPLIVLGTAPLPDVVALLAARSHWAGGQSTVTQDTLFIQMYRWAWAIPCTIFAAGLSMRWRWPAVRERLGLVRPSVLQVALALALAGVAVITMPGLNQVLGGVWPVVGWPRTDSVPIVKLLQAQITPHGFVLLSVLAALGMELVIRGLLQPRLGLLVANLFFTSLYALQYNWDGLILIFLLGLVLGLLRQRTNTTTSLIMHGTVRALLGLLALG
jgi:hypothetical protein